MKKAVQDLDTMLNSKEQISTSKDANASVKTSMFRTFDHFIMNLPATAVEFLDVLKGLFKDKESLLETSEMNLPMIHCHCFSNSETPENDVVERINSILEYPLQSDTYKVHFVRKVAPNKDMFCVSFRLSQAVAFAHGSPKRKQETTDISSNLDGTIEIDSTSKKLKSEE